ncbi:hypothetical protein N7535_008241 [Penicillium sp. DV-2018c]|nr:hypothetical protein N7461_004279 [Penicillium sp. DV-2018c]KAJ5566603.1 hypothetical protein N7535_008241 [Penicillium sp. DV-2018c]
MIDAGPADKKAVKTLLQASSQGPAYIYMNDTIQDVKGLPLPIDYYSRWLLEYLPGAVVFVRGLLSVNAYKPPGSSRPPITVRADRVVPCVSTLFFIRFYYY